jgi:Tfp pilus assembly protein PilO
MLAISKRERRLIVAGAVVAAAVGGYLYVVEPLREHRRESEELAASREATLERRRILVAQRRALEEQLAEAARRLDEQDKRLLKGPTPPLAASELQKLVKDVATAANVEVRSERILPPVNRDGLQEVPLELTVAGGIRESVNLLHQIERSPKLLTLQDVKVRVVAVGQPRDLLTTLTVSGYLLPSPVPAKPDDKPAGPAKE